MPAPTIDQLTLADEPARWEALGFDVAEDSCQIGTVRLRFSEPPADPGQPGIVGWSLRDLASGALSPEGELDGLPTTLSYAPISPPATVHPNGVVSIDHLVAASPDLDRSVASLQAAGLDLRRVREEPTPAGAPRQAFFRLGREILELIQEPEPMVASSPEGQRAGGRDHPARFWGIALVVADLDSTVERLAGHVSPARAAVQAGRRIATVRRSAGLAVPLALMSAEQQVG
ncbi:MAG TPA: VOC family protein [Solirubrobacteraceae bacterium]|jgi:hypothetical protein|nr:VOC family protein [Solirubrobacteraceae bacterium]